MGWITRKAAGAFEGLPFISGLLKKWLAKRTVLKEMRLGPANQEIKKQIRKLIAAALCVKIYGWPMMSLDNTLLRNMYRLLLSRPELVTQILDYLEIPKDLRDLTVVVTAGPNQEKIPDHEEYITNLSSGKQGFALARAAANRGLR